MSEALEKQKAVFAAVVATHMRATVDLDTFFRLRRIADPSEAQDKSYGDVAREVCVTTVPIESVCARADAVVIGSEFGREIYFLADAVTWMTEGASKNRQFRQMFAVTR